MENLGQKSFIPDPVLGSESVISDDPNQQIQPDPICSADVEADPTPGPDPIIGSVPFVKADTGVEAGDATHAPVGQILDPKPVPGSDPMEVVGGSNQTPVDKSSKMKRAKGKGKEAAEAGETPGWLPPGWTMICRTRTNGASAGIVDRYYVDQTTGQRFRSKMEVKRFLETGSKSKSISDAKAMPSDTPSEAKEKSSKAKEKSSIKTMKTSTEMKKEAPRSFDYENPPKEFTWSLVDGNQGLWKPSIGGEPVPEATVQDWKTTFEHAYKME